MRRDARSLLEKLSRKDFRYREFADPFPDTELWPIFEVVLRDERVVGEEASSLPRRERAVRPVAPVAASRRASIDTLFERYDEPAVPAGVEQQPINLRQFFSRLSDLG